MKKNLTRISAAILIVVMTFLVTAPSFPMHEVAASGLITQADIDAQQQALRNLQNQQQRLANERRQLAGNITNLERSFRLIAEEIALTLVLLEETQASLILINDFIDQREEELEVLEYNYEQRRQQLATRLRVMHEDGGHNLLEAIFEADNVFELLLTIDLINTLVQRDRRDLQELERQRAYIVDRREELEVNRIAAEQMRAFAISEQAQLEITQNEISDEIVRLHEEQLRNEEARRALEAEEARFERELQRIIAAFEAQNRDHGDMLWPAPTRSNITSFFGYRRNPFNHSIRTFHGGIDIGGPVGEPIVAAMAGTVIFAAFSGAAGNMIVIDHGRCNQTGNRIQTMYAHNNVNRVRVGDEVERGQLIADMGRTGNVTGAHLHFEVRVNGTRVNPMQYFPWHPQANRTNP